ncbi:MAG: DNA methyltransferase [Candidatus Methanoperedens sp.]
MTLSWSEVEANATRFAKIYGDETRERAEAQTFWNAFFEVFGRNRSLVASFEHPVKLLGDKRGSIDLLWKSVLIAEHKSAGKSLDRAFTQALDYFPGLKEYEVPKFIIVSDFQRMKIYDLKQSTFIEFKLVDLPYNLNYLEFMLGYDNKVTKEEPEVNIKAALLMGDLHERLKEDGYAGHQLELLMIRLVFCMFADNTGLFPPYHFIYYLRTHTKEDGTDLGMHIDAIFRVLNLSYEERQKKRNIPSELNEFPYVNGKLFEERFDIVDFSKETRELLLACFGFNWRHVSAAVFGSMFQSVVDESDKKSGASERRDFGMHYTSEHDIIKSIKPLFLDELNAEYELHQKDVNHLTDMLKRIKQMRLFDPACGCGTFLVISYRELRKMEIKIHLQICALRRISTKYPDVETIAALKSGIDVDSMYGIELKEFPVRIGWIALWIVDHQMNMITSQLFGYTLKRIPLLIAPHIIQGNALQMDWNDLVKEKEKLTYIVGNPPYAGARLQSKEQKEDMALVCSKIKMYNSLDYVSGWFIKAAEYIKGTKIKTCFVSTNSITQGEQVAILWGYLQENGIKIHFAHRTFKWQNDAKGNANVHVVIIGFAAYDTKTKLLYDYEKPTSHPVEMKADNINAYLLNQADVIINSRSKPLCKVPEMLFGNMPNDGGNFLFTDEEKDEFLRAEPDATKFMRPFIGAVEFLHGQTKWCLWLKDIQPPEIKRMSAVETRIRNVQDYRSKSTREATKRLAETSYLFGEIRQPDSGDLIVMPLNTSENRKYIPIDILSSYHIIGNTCSFIPNANLYHFGVITSAMHMAWMKQVCGRIKSDYRYSNKIVYNTFPWAENLPPKDIQNVEECAKVVLEVRKSEKNKNSSLADLYDPSSMPKELVDAHRKLDAAVDHCYRKTSFNSDLERIQYLFELYKELTQQKPDVIMNKNKSEKHIPMQATL